MTRQSSGQEEDESVHVDTYTHGYSQVFTQYLSRRTAASNAAFFLSYLRPGMSLLDCGCGPGTITIGLAQAVAPGQVVGIDLEPGQVEMARAHAAEESVSNVSYQAASVYRLPFPDESFDAVFGHSILEHVAEPMRALREMRRVLKPRGIVGLREVDQGGTLLEPSEPLLEQSLELQEKLWQANGGDPRIGRKLKAMLSRAGFDRSQLSGTYDVYGTADGVREWSERMVDHFSGANFIDRIVNLGWADAATLKRMRTAWKDWANHPEAFYARARVEGIGWVD